VAATPPAKLTASTLLRSPRLLPANVLPARRLAGVARATEHIDDNLKKEPSIALIATGAAHAVLKPASAARITVWQPRSNPTTMLRFSRARQPQQASHARHRLFPTAMADTEQQVVPPAAEEQQAEAPPAADVAAEQPANPPAAEQQPAVPAAETDAPGSVEAAAIPTAAEPAIDAAQAAAQAAAVAARLMASHGNVSWRHHCAWPSWGCPEVGCRGFKGTLRAGAIFFSPSICSNSLRVSRSTTTSDPERRRSRREALTRREPLLEPWTAATAWGAPTPWPLGCVHTCRVGGRLGWLPRALVPCHWPPPEASRRTARPRPGCTPPQHPALPGCSHGMQPALTRPPGPPCPRVWAMPLPPPRPPLFPLPTPPRASTPSHSGRAPWRSWTSPPAWWAS
jgi:hypothetical protein